MQIDENKLAVTATLGELSEAVAQRLEKRKGPERPVSTPALMEHFGISRTTVTNYHELGMKKAGYNRWMISECDDFINNKLPKILTRPGRKKK
jgi:hypothetical protein